MKNTDCLKISLAGLTMLGIWNPKITETSSIIKYLFYIYFIFIQTFMYAPLIAIQVMHVASVFGDIEQIMNIGLLLLTHLTMAPKIYVIWYRQHEIKYVFSLLDGKIFTRNDPKKQAIFRKTPTFAYMTSIFFGCVVFSTAALWAIFPMLKPTLELPLQYPYLNSSDPMFIPLYVYQIFAMTIVGLGAAAADFLIGGTMALASGAMDLLYHELEGIGTTRRIQSNALNCKDANKIKQHSDAVACVKFHGEIIKLMRELENMFSLPTLFQFMATSVIICGVAFKITLSNQPLEIITMIFYFVCVTTELLIYCYFGDLVREKSEKLSEGAYFSNWSNMNEDTRRVILLIIVRTQRPLVFTAGNVFGVTLTTFAAIMRTSYSYFAVLNQKHET